MPRAKAKAKGTAKTRPSKKARIRKRIAEAKRAAQVNHSHSHSQPKPQGKRAKTPAKQPLMARRSNLEVFVTDPNSIALGVRRQANPQVHDNVAAVSRGPQVEVKQNQYATASNNTLKVVSSDARGDASSQPFGHPGPRDPRFMNPVYEEQETMGAPILAPRSPDDVFAEKFRGIATTTLSETEEAIFQTTVEVALKWIRTWCPGLNLSRVHDLEAASYAFPITAIDTRLSDKTISQLFNDCRMAHDTHGINPTVDDVVSVAEICINFCKFLKDEKTAVAIHDLMEFAQWLDASLEIKSVATRVEASSELRRGDKDEHHVIEHALARYNVHRAELSIQLVNRTKEFVEYCWPSGLGGSNYILHPGESDSDGSEYLEYSDNSDYEGDSDENMEESLESMEVIVISESG